MDLRDSVSYPNTLDVPPAGLQVRCRAAGWVGTWLLWRASDWQRRWPCCCWRRCPPPASPTSRGSWAGSRCPASSTRMISSAGTARRPACCSWARAPSFPTRPLSRRTGSAMAACSVEEHQNQGHRGRRRRKSSTRRSGRGRYQHLLLYVRLQRPHLWQRPLRGRRHVRRPEFWKAHAGATPNGRDGRRR